MKGNLGLYIHIPFCLSRCNYCGFFSNACKSSGELIEYKDRLLKEIEYYSGYYGKTSDFPRKIDTIFIGGGTPSIMPEGAISELLSRVKDNFEVMDAAEISIESNPKTLTGPKLKEYLDAGVNRLSMGVQSFDKDVLKLLGRAHTAEDAVRSFGLSRDAGFLNINCDLMFGIPGQKTAMFMDSLEKLLDLGAEHISFYSLQIEENTRFYEMYKNGTLPELDMKLDREMYHKGIETLKSEGFHHYEISNSARPGFECRHNLRYWDLSEYLGIGASASSYIYGVRFTEEAELKYKGKPKYSEYHKNTEEDNMSEFTFTALRKTEGLSYSDFKARFGRDFWDVYKDRIGELADYFRKGLLTDDGAHLVLSEEGIAVSNDIMSVFV